MSGWIKLHRQIAESFVFDNPSLLKFWIWCLTKATHKSCTVAVGMKPVSLEPGQFVMGRRQTSGILKMSESMITRCIETLKSQGNLTVKSNNKFSIVTICKWSCYQEQEHDNRTSDDTEEHTTTGTTNEPLANRWRTAGEHKQECKEGKECKEVMSTSKKPKTQPLQKVTWDGESFSIPELLRKKWDALGIDVDREVTKAEGWVISKGAHKKNWTAFLNNWMNSSTPIENTVIQELSDEDREFNEMARDIAMSQGEVSPWDSAEYLKEARAFLDAAVSQI